MTLYCNIELWWHYIARLNCYDIILQHWILMTLYCNIHLLWHYIAILNCYDIILQHWILMTLYCNIHLLWHYIATPSKITKFIFQCKRRTWLNSSDSSIFLTSWGLVRKNSYLEKSSNGYYIVKTGSTITIDSVQFWFPLYHDVYQIFNPLWCFREEVCTPSPTPVLPNL